MLRFRFESATGVSLPPLAEPFGNVDPPACSVPREARLGTGTETYDFAGKERDPWPGSSSRWS